MAIEFRDISRRGLLRVAGATGLLAGLPTLALADPAPGQLRFRSVSVDTQPLADKGLPNFANRISGLAGPVVASVFANRLDTGRRDAPRLVVRIDSLTLEHEAGRSGPFFSDDAKDWISGAGEVVDTHGHVLKVEPIETSTASMFRGGGADFLSIEDVRMQRLITILAEWVDRYV